MHVMDEVMWCLRMCLWNNRQWGRPSGKCYM